MGWISLADALTARTDRDPERQVELRARTSPYHEVAALTPGESALLASLSEGSLGDDEWKLKKACGGPTTELFFMPEPDTSDPRMRDDRESNRVEFERDQRLAEAKALCDSCPVSGPCLAFFMRIGGRDKWSFGGGTTASERRQLRTWMTLEMRGGCPIVDEVGWKARRKLFLAMSSEARGKPFKLTIPEPQPSAAPGHAETMKCAVFSKTPWGVPVAVPYEGAWTSLPALGKAAHAEAKHRGVTLTDAQVRRMFDAFQLVDDLSKVVR